ncbi:TPA: sarcosine oxidase subunit alpha [Candidatus Bipolaricaulota bacterium]|nr:sarcosine oxidase subunit alpha [Candidatus Bipolaricaulota bacterium]
MRIEHHPILAFARGRRITFTFDGRPIRAFEGETIAAALHAAGVRILSRTRSGAPRGLFCAIGKCSSCLMTVDGIPNVRTCITPVREGMRVESQRGPGKLNPGFEPRPREVGERSVEAAVVGAGPAGLSAARTLIRHGVVPLVLDENPHLGGQLIKQTHKFFGSRAERAGTRGFSIAEELAKEAEAEAEVLRGARVLGLYRDGGRKILAVSRGEDLLLLQAEHLIVATGAQERFLLFPGNHLPGVYGAGAVQTLMNVYGVLPGKRALMVGAGNVGLIVAYQLLQAGVEVAAVVEAMPEIGGYHVHAAKIRRLGVPILTRHTVIRALGEETVEGAVIAGIDEHFTPIPGTERELEVDLICLATGLVPSARLLEQAGARMAYIPELGGRVPLLGPLMETTVAGVYAAGDCAGIGEASTAMLEGELAALSLLSRRGARVEAEIRRVRGSLERLRLGPFGERPRAGKERVFSLMKEVAVG